MAATAVNYTCPNCSAPLVFLPGHDKVSCEYCGKEFAVSEIENLFAQKQDDAAKEREREEEKQNAAVASGDWNADEAATLRAFTCSACGAEIISDANTMATECCYCGNPTMLPARFEGTLKPDLIIPFKKTKQDAVAALKNFYKGKYLLPNSFTAQNRIEAIQPMYVPFWLFDAAVEGRASFRAEKIRRTETRDEIITETNIYNCRRSGTMRFEKIPVDGSKKMADDYMDSIEPFDYGDLVPFSTAYLTGYLADKYDVTAKECAPRADKRMKRSVLAELERTVTGYNSVALESGGMTKTDGKILYAMVPVWILSTKYQNQTYTFMMNGQTGKVAGSLPYDSGKAFMYPAAAAVILFPVFYFLAQILLEG